MNVYLYFLFILINFVIFNITVAKYEPGSRNDRPAYLIKRRASKFNKEFYGDREGLTDSENSRILKEKIAGNNYDKQKRSNKIGSYGRRYMRLFKRELRPQRYDDAYGIVYGNGRPVGILEPYPQAFEYSPFGSKLRSQAYAENYYPRAELENSNIDEDLNEDKFEDSAQYVNNKYPLLYNNLMSNFYNKRGMGNVLENELNPADGKQAEKRKTKEDVENDQNYDQTQKDKKSSSSITDEQVEELKSTLSKIKNPGPTDSMEEIERNLRSILSDMGLVSDEENDYASKEKRDATSDVSTKEDENLEEGVNKIDLIKIDTGPSPSERNKREQTEQTKQTDDPTPLFKANAFLSKTSTKDSPSKVAPVENGDAFVRNKRQETKTDDIIKGLEKSGDLTVSGNKSPLASSEVESETTSHTDRISKREQNELDYQKHVEDVIQAKIDAIKEQVKREIEAMNSAEVSTSKNFEGRRRKRDLSNTLIEEETSDVDPQKHPGEKLIPYIRRRRNTDEATPLKRVKRNLLDFSHLSRIDSGDYLELAGDQHEHKRLDSDYQMDPQENKLLPKDLRANLHNSATQGSVNVDNEEHVAKSGERNLLSVINSDSDENLSATDNPEAQVAEKENPDSQVREKRSDPLKLEGNDEAQPLVANKANENFQEKEKEDNKNVLKLQKKSIDQNIQAEDYLYKGDSFAAIDKQNDISQIESARDFSDVSKLKKKESGDLTASLGKPASEIEDREITNVEKKMSEKASDLDLNVAQNSNIKNLVDKKNVEDPSSKVLIKESNFKKELVRNRRRVPENAVDEHKLKFRRKKRENDLISEDDMANIAYRSDDMEFDDEGDEFDDDSLDDRTMEKREAANDLVSYGDGKRSLSYHDYEDPEEYKANRKRSASGDYISNVNSDLCETQGNHFLYYPEMYVRRKRQNYDVSNLHNGAATLHHLAAIKERSMQRAPNIRNKRNQEKDTQKAEDLEGADLFGALPQSYNGELSRYKRVKRNIEQDGSES